MNIWGRMEARRAHRKEGGGGGGQCQGVPPAVQPKHTKQSKGEQVTAFTHGSQICASVLLYRGHPNVYLTSAQDMACLDSRVVAVIGLYYWEHKSNGTYQRDVLRDSFVRDGHKINPEFRTLRYVTYVYAAHTIRMMTAAFKTSKWSILQGFRIHVFLTK